MSKILLVAGCWFAAGLWIGNLCDNGQHNFTFGWRVIIAAWTFGGAIFVTARALKL
jgi:hypothetical protein